MLGGRTRKHPLCKGSCTSRGRVDKSSIKQVIRLRECGQMPRPTSFGKDTGLQLRMTFTLFLLGLVYVVLIVALLGAGVNGATVGILAGGLALFQLFGSD